MDKEFVIPDNIREWLKQHDGVNLAINYNSAFADYGYAHIIHHLNLSQKIMANEKKQRG